MTTNNTTIITPQAAARELLRRRAARRSLLRFIEYVKPTYDAQWFHSIICEEINNVIRGLLPPDDPDFLPNAPKRVIVDMPPRNGKSEIISRNAPAYAFGRIPDLQVIATSYGSDLASMMNRDVQEIIDAPAYEKLFPNTRLNSSNVRTTAYGAPLRNSDIFEIVGYDGIYKSAGIGGAMTGYGMHLGIVDDPIKNRDESESETYREKIWHWFTQTFYTRLLPGGAIIIMMTRWHDDDLVGRLLEQSKNNPDADQWRVISFPAIRDIEPDETDVHAIASRKLDPRAIGDVLWPERYPLPVLNAMKALDPDGFEALQQQRPVKPGGKLFQRDKFVLLDNVLIFADFEIVRYFDKAATLDGGAYTAGVLMAYDPQRRYDVSFIVLDVQRVQYDPERRERMIKQTAQLDAAKYGIHGFTVWIEQEPGSGGKESALNTIKNTLPGFDVQAEAVTGEKSVRWKPFAAQVNAGNVGILNAEFTETYLIELSRLPAGKYKDQADASAGAFNKLAIGWTIEEIIVIDNPVHISEF